MRATLLGVTLAVTAGIACAAPGAQEETHRVDHRGAPLAAAVWQIDGAAGEALGTAVANAGDVDGDGFDDLLIGAPGHSAVFAGEGRVVLARGGGLTTGLKAGWVARGGQIDAHLGAVVSGAGDVNGDGYADFAVGAPEYDALDADDGAVWVYLGGPGAPREGWFNHGDGDGARFGAALAAGDIDGDGFTEVVVSEPGTAASGSGSSGGRVLVFAGSASGPAVTGREIAVTASVVALAGDVDGDGRADFLFGDGAAFDLWRGLADGRLEAVDAVGSIAGTTAGRVGDIDGDGYDDVAVVDRGALTIHFGAPEGLAGSVALSAEVGALAQVAAADINGDGFADVIASTPAGTAAGSIVAFAGQARAALGATLWTTPCPGCAADPDMGFGAAVAAGDFDGDGRGDVAVASPGWSAGRGQVLVQRGRAAALGATPALAITFDPPGDGRAAFVGNILDEGPESLVTCSASAAAGAGQCRRWSGDPGGIHAVSSAFQRSEPGFGRAVAGRADLHHDGLGDTFIAQGLGARESAILATPGRGDMRNYWFEGGDSDEIGAALALDGDVDGDGVIDPLVGVPRGGSTLNLEAPGELWVFFPTLVPDAGFSNHFKVSMPGTPGWRVTGTVAHGELGRVASYAGDLDGDGRADIVSGAAGRVVIYRPNASGPSPVLTPPPDVRGFGAAAAGAGDLDGDGLGDVAVGAPGDGADRGRVFVYYGDRDAVVTAGPVLLGAAAESAGDQFGAAVASAGDVDGDGFADLLVGAPRGAGRVYLFRGGPDGVAAEPAWAWDGDGGDDTELGRVVAGGGDLDGDGYGDVAVLSRGHAWVFRGNGLTATRHGFDPRPANVGSTFRIAPWSGANGPSSFAVTMSPSRLSGTGSLRFELEVKRHDAPFDGALGATSPWQSGLDTVRAAVGGLTAATAYHWRGRVAFRASDVPLQGRLPWVVGGTSGQPHAVHVRTRNNTAPQVGDDVFVCERDAPCVRALLTNDRDGEEDPLRTSAATFTSDAGAEVAIGAAGEMRYVPPPGWVGVDTFEYEANDGVGGRALGTVTVSVVAPGCADDVAGCFEGAWSGALRLGDRVRGFRCGVEVIDGVRRLRCDTDARGDLRLGEPVCR